MDAVAKVWADPNLVQVILSHCKWQNFLNARAVNKLTERVSHYALPYWYHWLRVYAPRHLGQPIILKTVSLRLQCLRLAAKRWTTRMDNQIRHLQWTVEISFRKLQRAQYNYNSSRRDQQTFTTRLQTYVKVRDKIDAEFENRKRQKIDISKEYDE